MPTSLDDVFAVVIVCDALSGEMKSACVVAPVYLSPMCSPVPGSKLRPSTSKGPTFCLVGTALGVAAPKRLPVQRRLAGSLS